MSCMINKEKCLNELSSKLENSSKTKSRLEDKISELKALKTQSDQKIEELSKSKLRFEELVENLRKECEKLKRVNSDVMSKYEKAKQEKDAKNAMEKRIKECSNKLEKMNKEIDLERKKNTRLSKENMGFKKELETLYSKVTGDNSPEVLKTKIQELNSKITNLRKENNSKQKEINSFQLLFQEEDSKQEEIREIFHSVNCDLQSLQTWTSSYMSSRYIFTISNHASGHELDEYPKCIDLPKAMPNKPEASSRLKNLKLPNIMKQIDSLK